MVTWLALKVAFLSMCSHMTFGSNFISCTATETMGIQKTLSIIEIHQITCVICQHICLEPIMHEDFQTNSDKLIRNTSQKTRKDTCNTALMAQVTSNTSYAEKLHAQVNCTSSSETIVQHH
jgi:hypothetical protein